MSASDPALCQWLEKARALGFEEAAAVDPRQLTPMEAVREACRADLCRNYGKNWSCPPACGSLAACGEKLHRYHRGMLVQTVYALQKTIDTRGYAAAERLHCQRMDALASALRQTYPDALCLGAGGCRRCEVCAFPAPCRFPESAMSSMEAYGLFVTQVCRDAGLAYHHGEKTVTYSGCVLF